MQSDLTKALIFQEKILSKVSRSFALTIPELPLSLKLPIANCYLWCRISDTIEDDINLNHQQKILFHQKLILAINNKIDLHDLIQELLPKLSENTPTDEKILLENLHLINLITNNLALPQAKLIRKCVTVMNNLMPKFEQNIVGLKGLKNLLELKKYCYAVAGIVGETLTELFCEYLMIPKNNQYKLLALSREFGEGLQITNILKDLWSDYNRNVCWLPKNFFNNQCFKELLQDPNNPIFTTGIKKLIHINFNNLKSALEYTLNIPAPEIGIRKFCIWAIGIAIATLTKIYNNPRFTEIKQIKVSRIQLKCIMLVTNLIIKNNWLLKLWFDYFSRNIKNVKL